MSTHVHACARSSVHVLMCASVCLYTWAQMCAHVCVCTHMQVCEHLYLHVSSPGLLRICVSNIYKCSGIFTSMSVPVCASMCVCLCKCA